MVDLELADGLAMARCKGAGDLELDAAALDAGEDVLRPLLVGAAGLDRSVRHLGRDRLDEVGKVGPGDRRQALEDLVDAHLPLELSEMGLEDRPYLSVLQQARSRHLESMIAARVAGLPSRLLAVAVAPDVSGEKTMTRLGGLRRSSTAAAVHNQGPAPVSRHHREIVASASK